MVKGDELDEYINETIRLLYKKKRFYDRLSVMLLALGLIGALVLGILLLFLAIDYPDEYQPPYETNVSLTDN